MGYKIFAVNPGSTSTKVALFDGDRELFKTNVTHDMERLGRFPYFTQQLEYRKEPLTEHWKKREYHWKGQMRLSAEAGDCIRCLAERIILMN